MQKQSDWFLRLLAEGDSLLDESVICRFCDELGLSLADGEYFCLAVRYLEPMSSSSVHVLRLLQAIKRVSSKSRRLLCTFVGKNLSVVCIVRGKGGERERFCAALYRRLTSKGKEKVQMGVGRSFSELSRLSDSAAEAYEALGSKTHAEIRYINDIYAMRSFTAGKTEPMIARVLECFGNGAMEEMMVTLSQLCEFVRAETPVREGKPYPTSIRRTVLEVLLRVLHICSDMGIDTEAYLDGVDPYSHIFRLPDTPSILEWFRRITEGLYRSYAEYRGDCENSMLFEAKRLIAEQLSNSDLGLSFVSERIGITPSYFSSLFIQEMGVGFSEYVTSLRLELAKTLLSERKCKIGDVAARCGFRSSSYFIAVFRREVGMSPGEYRSQF